MSHRRAAPFPGAVIAALLAAAPVSALTGAEERCIDAYQNGLRLVSQQAGKDYRTCLKQSAKGDITDPDGCLEFDIPGKIAGKVQKVTGLYGGGTCNGTEPIQQGAADGNQAHTGGPRDLTRDLFGHPITSAVISPGKTAAKCIDKAIQRAAQLFTEKVKSVRQCAKSGMQVGSITDAATLEASCMTPTIPDPAGKIAGRRQRLIDDVNDSCAGAGPIATLFAGKCSSAGTTAALGACIAQRVECRVCETLNAANGTDRDCDLVDDGVANTSCGFEYHTCTLNTASCSPASNPSCGTRMEIHLAALPAPLVFGLSGTLEIGGGGSFADCRVGSLDSSTVPGIGIVCVTPGPSCAIGKRWCGPGAGPPLGTTVSSDDMAGICTSNAGCRTTANFVCGGAANVASSQCAGFCSGPIPQACTSDADCQPSNGACNGPEPVGGAANLCQVSCIDLAVGGSSDAGDIQCILGAHVVVEAAAPCDGTDVVIDGGDACIPFSTQSASALITNSNSIVGAHVPAPPNVNSQSGIPLDCTTVDSSTLSGLRGVGAFNIFGTALGDLSIGIRATCQ